MSGSNCHGARFALAALCLVGGPAVASTCTLIEAASLPASFKNGNVSVDVGVNGTPAKFLIDTGSSVTWISQALAERLSLPVVNMNMTINSDAGTYKPNGAIISELTIGHIVAHSAKFVTKERGGNGTTNEFSGVLSQEYLAHFDLELDPALGRVHLFEPIRCPDDAAYWSNEHFELPLSTDFYHRPMVRVTLDGQEVTALINTAAAVSNIDFAVARQKFGVTAETEPPLPSLASHGAAADRSVPASPHIFKELVFGPITVRNPTLLLRRYRTISEYTGTHIRTTVNDEAPVTIGMDILGKFHSLISYRNNMIYFTLPNERTGAPASPPKP